MDNICQICNQPITERSHVWKHHKIKEKDYYEKYNPKVDLLTNEKIRFKNPEQYVLTDFNDKRNLKKYLETSTKKEGLHYLSGWLMRRKELKDLIYAPPEFECKSLCFPSIEYIHKFFGPNSYENICQQNNLDLLFNYNKKLEIENKELNFICDSREQHYLKLPNIQISTLKYGDYSIENSHIFIERKSLSDAISTVSQGFKRFENEIKRCLLDNNYLIILIEEKYANLQGFEYLPHIHSKCDWIFISHRIRELLYYYPQTIQFLAVDGRKEAVRVIEKIFNLKNNIKELDLQYFYNKGDL